MFIVVRLLLCWVLPVTNCHTDPTSFPLSSFGSYNKIFTLWCLAILSKSTSFVGLMSLFLNFYRHSIHALRFWLHHSYFLASDFFHRGQAFCIWQGTSKRKDYPQTCLMHKYNQSNSGPKPINGSFDATSLI